MNRVLPPLHPLLMERRGNARSAGGRAPGGGEVPFPSSFSSPHPLAYTPEREASHSAMAEPPLEPDLMLTPPAELPVDMRAIWSMAVMHAQFKTLCLAL